MNKDIKDYLHLYLGCRLRFLLGGYMDLTPARLQRILESGQWQEYKPILRPLSDMTEEENNEYRSLYQSLPTMPWSNYVKHSAMVTRFLLSKSFDLFGLIESGLAIDKNKVNNHE